MKRKSIVILIVFYSVFLILFNNLTNRHTMPLHIIPLNDLKPHKECSTCECKPTLEDIEGEMMFVHNSYDGREKYEVQTKPELN